MRLLPIKARILSVMILAMSFLGCEDDDDANVLPEIIARFTQTIIEDSGTVTFINLSENADSFEWDFGDGTTSFEIDPVKTYATGTYTVTLTASNNAGASGTFEDQLVIVVPESITIPITFDDANVDYDVGTFGGAAFEIVANPAPGGSNDVASQVGAITNIGAEFEGIFFNLGVPLDLTEEKTITMNLWSEVAIDVLLKLEQGTGADTEVGANHGGSGWEMLSFDFASSDNFTRLTFFVDGPGTTAGTFYIDDVEQVETTGSSGDAPTEAAPTPPTRDAADVISLFSNVYTDITVDTFYAGFSEGGGVSDIQVAGDDVKQYTDLDFAGIETLTETVDLSNMTNFHINVWTATSFDLISRIVDFGGDGFDGGNDTQADERTTLTAEQWNTIDVTIADLQAAGLTATPTDFSQLILDVVDVIGTVYVDNIYFYKEPSGGGAAPTESAPVPPTRDAADVIAIFGESYTNITGIDYDPNWGQSGHMQVNTAFDPGDGNLALAYPNFNYQGTDFSGNGQDASAMEFLHLDIWVPTGTDRQVKVSPINNGTGAGEVLVEVPLVPGSWNSVDLPIGDFTGMTWDSVVQMKFDGQFNSDGSANTDPFDIYLDNIYFYRNATSPPTAATSLPIDFESNETLSGVFEEGDGVTGAPIANPDQSGINASATVYEFDKVSGAAWFSGMFQIFPSDLDAGQGTTFKVKIWSPKAGINVRFQLEKEGNQGPIVTYNLDQTVATANTWVELTFDFSTTALNLADGYDKFVIFPDFDDVGQPAGDGSIYYIDDIIQE